MAKRKKKNKRYTDEFKKEAVRLLATRGDSTAEEIASSLEVLPGMLYQWRKQLSAEPLQAIGESYEEEARRLRKENSQIKKENLTLKKSIALFVRDMDL
jgi:transposase